MVSIREKIVITNKFQAHTIISFRDTNANILSKAGMKIQNQTQLKKTCEWSKCRSRADIRTSVVNQYSYLPPYTKFDNINYDENLTKPITFNWINNLK